MGEVRLPIDAARLPIAYRDALQFCDMLSLSSLREYSHIQSIDMRYHPAESG